MRGGVVLIFLMVMCMAFEKAGLFRLLPDPPPGWRASDRDRLFRSDGLYAYLDGGAELYLSYGVKVMVGRDYRKEGQPDIFLDIFDMGSSENAFGVFSLAREQVDSAFGQGSQYSPGLLQFWKDRYYVSLLAVPETEESREVLFTLARQIDLRIPRRGALPPLLSYLPDSGLIPQSVRYFRHPAWLNASLFIAEENLLLIDAKTHAVSARYRFPHSSPLLLVIDYPSTARREAAFQAFRSAFLSDWRPETPVCPVGETWVGAIPEERLLVLVFESKDRTEAEDLLSETMRRYRHVRRSSTDSIRKRRSP